MQDCSVSVGNRRVINKRRSLGEEEHDDCLERNIKESQLSRKVFCIVRINQ